MSSKMLAAASLAHMTTEKAAIENGLHPERRSRARTEVHWPILLLREKGPNTIETVTENLSSMGFYCFSTVPVMPGESLRCSLQVPSHDPKGGERNITLECHVQVLRSERTANGSFGIACRIEDYRMIPGRA